MNLCQTDGKEVKDAFRHHGTLAAPGLGAQQKNRTCIRDKIDENVNHIKPYQRYKSQHECCCEFHETMWLSV